MGYRKKQCAGSRTAMQIRFYRIVSVFSHVINGIPGLQVEDVSIVTKAV